MHSFKDRCTNTVMADWTSPFYQLPLTFLYLHLLVTSSAGGKSLVRPRTIKPKPNICIVFVPELQDILYIKRKHKNILICMTLCLLTF